MRFFTYFKTSILFLILAGGLLLSLHPSALAVSPRMYISTAEVTIDTIDCAGDPSEGYVNGTTHLRYSFGEPCAITKMTNGDIELQSGYFSQDLVPPSPVSSIWGVPGGLARSITLQWTAPGDNLRDDINLSGTRVQIATTTSRSDADTPSYWLSRRDTPDIWFTTSTIAAQSICTYRITGLIPNTSYFFHIWTLDQAANWSDLSGGGTTYAEPVILSVYVLDISTINFGVLETNFSSVSASGLVVRNDGNTTETYSLRAATGTTWPSNTVWDIANTPGDNVFALFTIFNATRPAAENFGAASGNDALTLNDIQCTDINYSMGYEKGSAIIPYMTSPLLSDNTAWFLIKTPLATSTTSSQIISIIYTASETE